MHVECSMNYYLTTSKLFANVQYLSGTILIGNSRKTAMVVTLQIRYTKKKELTIVEFLMLKEYINSYFVASPLVYVYVLLPLVHCNMQ